MIYYIFHLLLKQSGKITLEKMANDTHGVTPLAQTAKSPHCFL